MRADLRSDHEATNDLRVVIETALRAEYGPSAVRTLERAAFALSSSYPAEVVRVGLVDGQTLTIFLKDLSTRRYDVDLRERRSREIAVYRDLLAGADLGTARYYGSVVDPARNRFWLLLEHVEGSRVDYEGFELWVRAAAWLGRLQAYVAAHPDLLGRCRLVRPLTTDFFLATAAAAERAAAAYGPDLGARVARALRGYPDLAAGWTIQPFTLVHGCYRPQNIVLGRSGATLRVCPVDWETAALGPSGYDLAYLSDGYDDGHRRIFVEAYRTEAARHGLHVHEDDEAEVLLDGCDLHKNLKTLGKAVTRDFPLAGVQKLVGMVEVAAARALQGRAGRATRSRTAE
jgi:aminoglycoside phosphotransferase (APT) family kinase protein